MGSRLPLFPEQASMFAPDVDRLTLFLVVVSGFFTLLIFGAIFYFAIRYRRRSEHELPGVTHGPLIIEIAWSVIPLGISMVMFGWGASVFFSMYRPPRDAIEVYAVGKQWMWKVQHMEGAREINELHIPLGRAVRVTLTSEDVIHSFYIPAFRTKSDVLPGRYTTTWFQPRQTGKFHLFCAEYCGTKHSGMIGWVYVMQPEDYQAWLNGGRAEGSLASRGEKLFTDLACANCHKNDGTGRCPPLLGLFNRTVELAGGGTVKADEAYFRESILNPTAKVVAGYQPIMPTFQGLVTEEGIVELIEYIKSLTPRPQGAIGGGTTPALQRNLPADASTSPSISTSSPNKR